MNFIKVNSIIALIASNANFANAHTKYNPNQLHQNDEVYYRD